MMNLLKGGFILSLNQHVASQQFEFTLMCTCYKDTILHGIIHCITYSLFSLSEPVGENFMK